MRFTSKDVALLTLPTLINGAAVHLSDMTPRAENLPEACERVYTSPIPGCTDYDFASGECSRSCFYSLNALVQPVQEACGDRGITGQNLIVAYLAGVGPEQICRDAAQWTTGGGSPFTSEMPKSWTAWASKTTQHTQPPKTTVTSGTITASSIDSGKSSLIYDTSKTPTTGALTSQTSSSGTSKLPDQLNTGDHSGGGSPFDTPGNMGGAATLSFSAAITILSGAIALFTNFR